MSEPIKALPFSPLEKVYFEAMEEKQKHYRVEWFKFFGLTRPQFYARLRKPQIIDLVLWQIVCDELLFPDKIIREYEIEFKDKLKSVKVFQLPQSYINQIEELYNL
jgi:hypothetical protein